MTGPGDIDEEDPNYDPEPMFEDEDDNDDLDDGDESESQCCFASQLRKFIVADPISHERGAAPDRTFRVDNIAALCKVEADTVRLWALGAVTIPDSQVVLLVRVFQ